MINKIKDFMFFNFDEYEIEIMTFCENLQFKMLEKYRKGRKEHGGKPRSINVQKEINLEVLDILNYHLIEKVNEKKGKSKKQKS